VGEEVIKASVKEIHSWKRNVENLKYTRIILGCFESNIKYS
jgi:hypothetical protein